jgi:hypothetical protein
MPARRGRLIALVIAVVGVFLLPAAAAAQRRGGSSPQMQQMRKKMQEQAQWQQQEMQRYQTEMAAKQAEIAKQYDADGNGKLTGPEKSKFDKYMHDVQKGKVANPFAGIAAPGQGPKPAGH